jgi:hypothetical protein
MSAMTFCGAENERAVRNGSTQAREGEGGRAERNEKASGRQGRRKRWREIREGERREQDRRTSCCHSENGNLWEERLELREGEVRAAVVVTHRRDTVSFINDDCQGEEVNGKRKSWLRRKKNAQRESNLASYIFWRVLTKLLALSMRSGVT